MACSSPRLVVWCGSEIQCKEAAEAFYRSLEEQLSSKGYVPDIGARINRFAFACGAVLDQGATHYTEYGPGLALLDIDTLGGLSREHCGGGLLFQFHARSLDAIVPFVTRRDQTLTYFGFEEATLRSLAGTLNGRGIDRIVSIGQALAFERYWDGYDLLQEMTRRIYIVAARP